MIDLLPISATVENMPEKDILLSWRKSLIRYIMRSLFFFMLPAMVAASYYAFTEETLYLIPIYAIFLVLTGVITFWQRIPYHLQVGVLLGLMYAGVWLNFLTEGRGALGRIFLLAFIFLATLFFGFRWGVAAIVLVFLTMAGAGVVFVQGLVPNYVEISSTNAAGWISNTFFVVVFGVLFISSLQYVLAHFQQALATAQQAAADLERSRDNLEQKVTERTRRLDQALANAEEVRELLERRVWLATGQTALNAVMRGEQDLTTLANRITEQVCTYLDAPLAVLFVREGDFLVRAGGFAAPTGDMRFKLGEGVVGETAVSGRATLITDIADNYFMVNSSFGAIKPTQIYVLPLLYESSDVIGVLEMGCLQTMRPRDQEFLDLSCESIAIALNTATIRTQMNRLLAKTQQQTESLQAQEEELRAINDELALQAKDASRQEEAG